MNIQTYDDRRDLLIGATQEETLLLATEHWISTVQQAIARHGQCAVALSGGSTPRALYQKIASPPYAKRIDWTRVLLFWSDERTVPPHHPDSNYLMALESGLLTLPAQIFRMHAEEPLEKNAQNYEALIKEKLGNSLFDLVMLGMGEDGHTASLFPHTEALKITDHLVAANYLPNKKNWRMTLTFPCIQQSRLSVFYVLGAAKQPMVSKVLHSPPSLEIPASLIGTKQRKALWILDRSAYPLLENP